MTVHVTLEEAQAKLAELVVRVRGGEEVVIDQDGAAVAVLSPPASPSDLPAAEGVARPKRKLGVWNHLNLKIDPNIFLEPDLELEELMDKPIWPE